MHVLVTADTMSGSPGPTLANWSLGWSLAGCGSRSSASARFLFPSRPPGWIVFTGWTTGPPRSAWSGCTSRRNDLAESSTFLANLVREVRPDVLQLHQFCYGNLPVDVPRIVMAHGDLISWTRGRAGLHAAAHALVEVVSRNCRSRASLPRMRWSRLRPACSTHCRSTYGRPRRAADNLSRTQSDFLQSLHQQR